MSTAAKSSSRELRRCWLRFSEIIRMFAEKRIDRNELSAEDYESIHAELLQSLREATESAPEKRELYSAMQELSKPWISVGAIQQADTPVLKDLAKRCDTLYQRLTNRSPATLSKGIALTILIAVFLGTFAVLLGTEVWTELLKSVLDGGGGTIAEWWQALERNRNQSRSWLLGFVAAVATVAAAYFVFRAPRNY